ncbi:DUF1826 domain-containing protein [Aurantiacibacter gangjinensis]|uniref:DUF1826 domain-containing protein n=1 Tax=Aurantiacibacter gangjinensis TaxID=502682 RepID=A0A0G9MN77_9SPHN|nr:DUF1826 domain-containing protein [Aurantiacibacter gangjinensis]KLE32135.1 hypothetical protein AAW01_12080 [Aurantiacibacter gangjinensis]
MSADRSILSAIRSPECSLAVWQRTPLAKARELPLEALENIRFNAPLFDYRRYLSRAVGDSEWPAGTDWLVDDVADLAATFAEIMQVDALETRLEIVVTNACRRFHADYVSARLITTYAGQGTQWLERDEAARVAGGLEPARVDQLSAGDVGVFKGKLGDGAPAIHRSPPIAGTGERRLLLVINPVDIDV